MNANQSFTIDVLLVGIGLLAIVYLIYGKIKHKPLIGDYRPGEPGYNTFLRLINSSKYLTISVIVTLLLIVNMVFDIQAVLHDQYSNSVLIVAPVMFFITLLVALTVIPIIFKYLFGKNVRYGTYRHFIYQAWGFVGLLLSRKT